MSTDNITELPAHENMSVEDVLSQMLRRKDNYTDVLVLAYAKDGGGIVVRSSHMSRAEANFMLDMGKEHALFGDADG